MKTISVIVPYHNRFRYLAEALRSIQAQTLRPNEIIVVDDCSGPEAQQHLAQFSHQVSIVRLPVNLGQSAARNTGVAHSRGDLIAFLDSDDVWEPAKLEIQAEYLNDHPHCAGCHTGITALLADGSHRTYLDKPPRLSTAQALQQTHVMPSAFMCRADVFRQVGGFDERLPICEDQELLIRLTAAGHRIDFLPQALTGLRREHLDRQTAHWGLILRGDLAVIRKHWGLYESTLGRGGARRYLGHCFRKVGGLRGKVLGRCLKAVGYAMGGRLQ